MSRPTLARAVALELIQRVGLALDATHPVISLGIRGGLEAVAGENKVGVFDDAIAVVSADVCEAFIGNCDPSSETANRANLKAGVSYFKQGPHHPGTPKEYPAFVQAAPVIVKRWGTEDVPAGTVDARGTCLGDGFWQGWFEIHIHNAMGMNTTGSEGCQTVREDQWPEYHDVLAGELKAHNVAVFPYALYERTSADQLTEATA